MIRMWNDCKHFIFTDAYQYLRNYNYILHSLSSHTIPFAKHMESLSYKQKPDTQTAFHAPVIPQK